MIIEQLTGKMTALDAKRFAESTATFIPLVIQVSEHEYIVGKEAPALIPKNKYIYSINEDQIVKDLSLITDLRHLGNHRRK